MSIKFPDFQVLVTRSDQIPKTTREGDQSGAGRLAPQVTNEFTERQRRIDRTPTDEKVRPRKEKEKNQGQRQSKQQRQRRGSRRRIDIRA